MIELKYYSLDNKISSKICDVIDVLFVFIIRLTMLATACQTLLLVSCDVVVAQCILRSLGFVVRYVPNDLSLTHLASTGEIRTYAIISPQVYTGADKAA